MARITVEDCLAREPNRFALVMLAAKRTKQILHGAKPVLEEARENKAVVTSLREVADGRVRFMTEQDREFVEAERQRKEESERSTPTVNIENGSSSSDSSSDSSDDSTPLSSLNGDGI